MILVVKDSFFLRDSHGQCHFKRIVYCAQLFAEIIAMVKGLVSAVHISELLKELCSEIKNIPMGIYTDSKSLQDVL